jgi:hypothetical protein
MGHNLTALIGKQPIYEEKPRIYQLPFIYEKQSVVIVPLIALHSDLWTEKLELDYTSQSEIILDRPVTHFFARELGLLKYALISTDYFGGWGTQYAAVYNNETVVLPAKEGANNEALRCIRIVKESGCQDEFDSIRLGNYRHGENYFEE